MVKVVLALCLSVRNSVRLSVGLFVTLVSQANAVQSIELHFTV